MMGAMKNTHLAPLALLLLGAACTTPAYVSPVEVTRFAAAQPAPLVRTSITLAPAPGTLAASADYAAFEAAVASSLATLGYQVVPAGGAQEARIALAQSVMLPEDRRSPVSVGGGASVGSYGSGIGLGIGIDLSGPDPERIATRLTVTIRDGAGTSLWEGRANMVASGNSDAAAPAVAAARMANALFQGFPGESGATISVP